MHENESRDHRNCSRDARHRHSKSAPVTSTDAAAQQQEAARSTDGFGGCRKVTLVPLVASRPGQRVVRATPRLRPSLGDGSAAVFHHAFAARRSNKFASTALPIPPPTMRNSIAIHAARADFILGASISRRGGDPPAPRSTVRAPDRRVKQAAPAVIRLAPRYRRRMYFTTPGQLQDCPRALKPLPAQLRSFHRIRPV